MTDRSLTRFFLGFAAHYKSRFLISFALIPLYAGLLSYAPRVIQRAIDEGIMKGDLRVATYAALLYLACMFGGLAVLVVQTLCMQTAGIRTLALIRDAVMQHICKLGRATYDQQPLGVYVSRATSDVEAIGETMSAGLTNIISDALLIVFIYINIFMVSATLGWWTLVLLPIIVVVVDYYRRVLRRLYDEIRTVNGRLTARINESLTMIFEVQNFSLGDAFSDDFDRYNSAFRDKNIKAISHEAEIYSIIEGLSFVAIGAVFVLITRTTVMADGMQIGGIVAYIQWLGLLFPPIKQMGSRFAVLQAALAAINKVHQVLTLPLPRDDGKRAVTSAGLDLQDVCFAYVEGEPVVEHLDLHVPAGSSAAIVGPTGAGKSTVIRLLVRQYEVTAGRILIGGAPIDEIPRQLLKETIVLVPQEPSIFHESVFYNIALNRPEVTREQVQEICRNIQADDFIRQLPGGYEATLESDGSNLSIGQRQLIALARALASPASVLIFDEATANIDTKTELMIQQALAYVMRQKTTILIAHRLSTIREVDMIVVMHHGRIVDQGRHRELLSRPGLYAQMYALQTKYSGS